MKKMFACRLIAFLVLCFISVAIKSETLLCKSLYSSIHTSEKVLPVNKEDDSMNNIDYKSEPFIIKI